MVWYVLQFHLLFLYVAEYFAADIKTGIKGAAEVDSIMAIVAGVPPSHFLIIKNK